MQRPKHVIFVFGDQHRAQDCGYAGNGEVHTPHMDALAGQGVRFDMALSGMPVCSPYRASLMTGQYPLTHGVFVNDVCLPDTGNSLAQCFKRGGYDTAYFGKWHLDGHGRSSFIPPQRRQGFDTWQVLECTHDYNHSPYYEGDSPQLRHWQGYDAAAQTEACIRFMQERDKEQPLLLMLSWGPPHGPYDTAPAPFRDMYSPEDITLRPNVPREMEGEARRDLAGYYAHISALDACLGRLMGALEELGMGEDTLLIYTSDHGDMLGSQGARRKQRPWDESIRVPFLMRWPGGLEPGGRVDTPFDAPDIMPTLLDICGLPLPEDVEGRSFAPQALEGEGAEDWPALLSCATPFGEFIRQNGGREYRGIRTRRYTWVRDLSGPWLFYDNQEDPYQMHNLVGDPAHADRARQLDARLGAMLEERGDAFLPGVHYIAQWGYPVDETGTVPYTD